MISCINCGYEDEASSETIFIENLKAQSFLLKVELKTILGWVLSHENEVRIRVIENQLQAIEVEIEKIKKEKGER